MDKWVCVATYNEKENIRELIEQIHAHVPDAHIVVVDDNSPDGTGKILDELAQAQETVQPIHRSGKLGYASAHIEAMGHALAQGAEIIVTMDADFSHDPKYLPALLGLVQEGADLAIGSRYIAGGGTQNWPWHRKALSGMANGLARTALGLSVHDCTGGFRAYRSGLLRRLRLDRFESEGYSFLEEILTCCQLVEAKMSETPIIFVERRAGRSKISRKVIFEAAWMLMKLAWRRRFSRKALLGLLVPTDSSAT